MVMSSRELTIAVYQRADLAFRIAGTKALAWQQGVPGILAQRLVGVLRQLLSDDQLEPFLDALRLIF